MCAPSIELRKDVYDFIMYGEKLVREADYTLRAAQDALDNYLTDF